MHSSISIVQYSTVLVHPYATVARVRCSLGTGEIGVEIARDRGAISQAAVEARRLPAVLHRARAAHVGDVVPAPAGRVATPPLQALCVAGRTTAETEGERVQRFARTDSNGPDERQ